MNAGNTVQAVLCDTPFTANSTTTSYSSKLPVEDNDFRHGFVLWYKTQTAVPAMFYLASSSSCNGGIKFAVKDGGVLYFSAKQCGTGALVFSMALLVRFMAQH